MTTNGNPNNSEDPNRRNDIRSGLQSIVESSDKWLARLRKREWHARLASSFLTGSLFALAVGILALIIQIVQGQLYLYFQYPDATMSHPAPQLVMAFAVAGASALAGGLISGFTTYFLLKRKHTARMKDLSSLVTEMKKKIGNEQQKTDGNGKGIIVDALSIAEKIVTLLPELVRKRSQDSWLFGAVAFALTAILVENAAAAIIVGVAVWLYFRYVNKKAYEKEISKFEEQKRVFEQQKKDFLDSL
jgi:uncharacterized integral membrane protein